jgi:hypothetical protein
VSRSQSGKSEADRGEREEQKGRGRTGCKVAAKVRRVEGSRECAWAGRQEQEGGGREGPGLINLKR